MGNAVVTTFAPTTAPSAVPTARPTSPTGASSSSTLGAGLTLGAIIGIAVGGFCGLVICVGAAYYLMFGGGSSAPTASGPAATAFAAQQPTGVAEAGGTTGQPAGIYMRPVGALSDPGPSNF